LKNVIGNKNLLWNYLPANGSAGGILVGINLDVFEVLSWEIIKFSINVVVKIKSFGVTVRLSTIYGSPYKEGKDEFISELHELFRNWEE
jgi:hypothetical protein